MAGKDRFQYFRSRTAIGKLENIALAQLYELGHHAQIMIRDDRYATSMGCKDCDTWGCVETDDKKNPIHGTIFEYRCGMAPKLEVTQDGVDILRAISG